MAAAQQQQLLFLVCVCVYQTSPEGERDGARVTIIKKRREYIRR
jgi:hypothetical protein